MGWSRRGIGGTYIIPIILNIRMRLAPNNRHRPPPKNLLTERPHIRQVIIQPRTSITPHHTIQLLLRPGHHLRIRTARQYKRDQRARRRITPRAEEVAIQRRDLHVGQAVLGRFFHDLLGVAVSVVFFTGRFFGERVVEVAAAGFATAEAVFPGCYPVGEVGECCFVEW